MSLIKSTNNNNNNNSNIDDEWSSFITTKYEDSRANEDTTNVQDEFNNSNKELNSTEIYIGDAPESTDIYISTKSKIAYLEKHVNLNIFWDIPIIPYASPCDGVIKKQIKINSSTQEDLDIIQNRLKKEIYYEEHIISHIDNPNGRIKFKDTRKITVGISIKDMTSYRLKKKKAFYNCFVMIIRIKLDNLYREFHTKVFNTGKVEVPGIQSDSMYETVLKKVVDILQPYHEYPLVYKQKSDTILINSNFSCRFFINREVLYDILRIKYNIQAIYDSCSYPGIQCKFYYNNDIGVQTGVQITTENINKYKNITPVSFMIFRTGSVLIVGKCDEHVLYDIYKFLKALLKIEFKYICQEIITDENFIVKDKKKKLRKKKISIITGIVENKIELDGDVLTLADNVLNLDDDVLKLHDDVLKLHDDVLKLDDDVLKLDDDVLKLDGDDCLEGKLLRGNLLEDEIFITPITITNNNKKQTTKKHNNKITNYKSIINLDKKLDKKM